MPDPSGNKSDRTDLTAAAAQGHTEASDNKVNSNTSHMKTQAPEATTASIEFQIYFDSMKFRLSLLLIDNEDVQFLTDRLAACLKEVDAQDDSLFLALDGLEAALSWLTEDPAIAASGAARAIAILFREGLRVQSGARPKFFTQYETTDVPSWIDAESKVNPNRITFQASDCDDIPLQSAYECLVKALVETSNALSDGGQELSSCCHALSALNAFLASPPFATAVADTSPWRLSVLRQPLEALERALAHSLAGRKTTLLHERNFEDSPSFKANARKPIDRYSDLADGILISIYDLAKKALKSRTKTEEWLLQELDRAGITKNGKHVIVKRIYNLRKKASAYAPRMLTQRRVPEQQKTSYIEPKTQNKVPLYTFKAWHSTKQLFDKPSKLFQSKDTLLFNTRGILKPSQTAQLPADFVPIQADEAGVWLWKARVLIQSVRTFQ